MLSAVLRGVILARFLFVILSEYQFTTRDERMVCSLFAISGIVTLGCITILFGCKFKVLSGHIEMLSTQVLCSDAHLKSPL
ncbi:hypothetical protein AS156_36500 [Bradyrhizobium macuxiense]|uniref:Uncharacterized protein n=1 Tax=Bradyrhizobium macuxiense TaxID=1755647 RepID=A0A109K082_9BRAD|nr:hypothetical protein AS156_36500 [Bradyrhizobium macuxiense]